MKYVGIVLDKTSFKLSARNPFRKDEAVIDYDMDSEEEWNEQNGEDLEGKPDDDEESEEEKMIIE